MSALTAVVVTGALWFALVLIDTCQVAAAYDELNQLFEDQLKRSAFFVPVAFHVHSPDSHDWGRSAVDGLANDRANFKGSTAGINAFLDRLAAHFAIVCITDHLKSGYACALAKAAEARNDITVFPGVEASVVGGGQLGSSRIHLLAIFPPGTKATQIDRIYLRHADGAFPDDEDRTGKEEFKLDGSLSEWAKLIRDQGGIFIVAHVDEYARGLRTRFRTTREGSLGFVRKASSSDAPDEVVKHVSGEYLGYVGELAPNALEVTHSSDRQHYADFTTQDGKKHRLPCVSCSDHHSIEDFARDELTTWVKVAQHDFVSVTDALRFFETRIRFKDDLPKAPSPRLVGIRIRSPKREGLFEDAVISFNPNLNCLIGARGSGKSTVIEALRYVMGLNSALDTIRAEQGMQLNYGEIAKRIQDANLAGSLIEVIYEADGERYRLSATFDALTAVTPAVHRLDGAERAMTIEAIAADFPLRLYSWSELETLGRDVSLQRGLLDRLVPGLLQLIERRTQLVEDLAANRRTVEGLTGDLQQLIRAERGLLRRYAQYKRDFELINTPEVAQSFADLDEARARVAILGEINANLQRIRSALMETVSPEAHGLQPVIEEHSYATKVWWTANVGPTLDLPATEEAVRKAVAVAISAIDNQLSALAALIEAQDQAVSETAAKLRVQTQSDPGDEVVRDQREERKTRYDALVERRENYLAKHLELEQSLDDRSKIVDQLEKLEAEIAAKREASRTDLLEKLSAADTGLEVAIDLKVGGDRSAAIEFMRESGFLTRDAAGHFKDKKVAERCCAMATPTTIARALLASDVALLEADGVTLGSTSALSAEEARKLVEHFAVASQDTDANVTVIESERLLQILQLQERHIDDEMRIKLGSKPVDELSPGQRSSAMLPLVALSENVPLVMDQPEDNLDQRMVGKTLTKILADLKETRQIIVTTHNPNIVVGGDAEQVIVLDSVGAHEARVEHTGSIDNRDIIDHVLGIMEGGPEAFQARHRRYQIVE